MSTTDFEAIDPLGGILHPNWKLRKAELDAEKQRSPLRRLIAYIAARRKSDEPNLTTGDTRLDVDPGEAENLPRLTFEEAQDAAAIVAAMEGFEPVKTKFYDNSLARKRSS